MDFTDASSITDKAVLLILNMSSFGTSRKISMADINVKADKTRIKAQKTLLASKETEAIRSFDGFTKKWVIDHCLPFEQRSIHLIPLSMIEEAEEYLSIRMDKREELITALLDVYPALKERDRAELDDVFCEDDYPSVGEVRESYSMRWKFAMFTTPTNLKQINRALFERERERAQKMWAEAGAVADQYLHQSMKKLVTHMLDKLTGKEDGKKKQFHASTVDNINRFLATFNPRNVNNNEELASLAERLRDAMDGIDVKDLKKSRSVRETVELEFTKVRRKLDSMMIDRPKRMITLDDDEEEADVATA